MIFGLRCASDADIKTTIANLQKVLEEAKKEGNEQRIETCEETIHNLKGLLQMYNN